MVYGNCIGFGSQVLSESFERVWAFAFDIGFGWEGEGVLAGARPRVRCRICRPNRKKAV